MTQDLFIRELFTNKIYADEYSFRCLSNEELFDLAHLKETLLNKIRFSDMMTLDQTVFLLKQKGLFPQDGESKIEKLKNNIDDEKIALFKSYPFAIKEREKIKAHLKKQKKQLTELENMRLSLKGASREGYVDSYVLHQQIILSALHKNNKIEKMSHALLINLINKYFSGIRDEIFIRKTVLNNQWQGIWSIHKPNPFSLHYNNLNINQQQIIIYSKFYDRVYENPNSPIEDVIKDHDALDGWYILQSRESKKAKTKEVIDTKSEKRGDLFIQVQPEDVGKIYDLNR